MSLMTYIYNGLSVGGVSLSVYASYSAFLLSVEHVYVAPLCPIFLGIPACFVVFISYVLLSIAWGMALIGKQNRWASLIFIVGSFPAFLLALTGVVFEVSNLGHCPETDGGFPKCFISFGLLFVLMTAWGAMHIIKGRLPRV